jgi:hypothetical protein
MSQRLDSRPETVYKFEFYCRPGNNSLEVVLLSFGEEEFYFMEVKPVNGNSSTVVNLMINLGVWVNTYNEIWPNRARAKDIYQLFSSL